ncbi:septum site-determining protein MinD [compost metagenome]
MAIIVFGGQKGGTGKSTLAWNIGAERAAHGKKVLLVDTDEQLTMAKWAARRKEARIEPRIPCISLYGETVGDEVMDHMPNYDDIIIDCHGGMTAELISALSVADKFFAPTQTNPADLDTFPDLDKLIPRVRALNKKLKAYIVINQAVNGSRVNQAKRDLEAANVSNFTVLDFPIVKRTVFGDTSGDGMAVTEYERRNGDAVSEILLLAEEVWA